MEPANDNGDRLFFTDEERPADYPSPVTPEDAYAQGWDFLLD